MSSLFSSPGFLLFFSCSCLFTVAVFFFCCSLSGAFLVCRSSFRFTGAFTPSAGFVSAFTSFFASAFNFAEDAVFTYWHDSLPPLPTLYILLHFCWISCILRPERCCPATIPLNCPHGSHAQIRKYSPADAVFPLSVWSSSYGYLPCLLQFRQPRDLAKSALLHSEIEHIWRPNIPTGSLLPDDHLIRSAQNVHDPTAQCRRCIDQI